MVCFEVHVRSATAPEGEGEAGARTYHCHADPSDVDKIRCWLVDQGVTLDGEGDTLRCRVPEDRFAEVFQVSLRSSGKGRALLGEPVFPDELAPLVERLTLSSPEGRPRPGA